MPAPPGPCWLLVLLVATLALAGTSATVFGTSASAAAAASVSQVEVPAVPLAPPPGGVKKVMYYDGKTLARVEYGQDGVTLQTCRLFELDDEREAEPIIKAQGLPVQPVDLATMLRLISQCRELRDWTASTNSTLQWSASSLWSGIIPGEDTIGTPWRI
ncbi:uncharacterized protein LOC120837835 [Ixodes scapularis]|uniref:uncharacterized protein LOC120837835 n=1 Tax=Ixodes scapularis TaxID=6945 RepID=UPI001C3918A5|nr:uncharacterized protein LOC120837835 [Ixodes scapularis]